MRPHPSVRTCACGHLEADHKSSGAGSDPLRFGVCLIAGCPCRAFVEVAE